MAATTTTYHFRFPDGVQVFYREAGPAEAPVILLLHGFPSSSRMYAALMPLLADRYHLIAPDYPGFGHSGAPDPQAFAYTFDRLAEIMDALMGALNMRRYVLFMQDYDGPVGFRLALAHPERVRALVIQNAVAHEEGLGPVWETRRAFWQDRAAYEDKLCASPRSRRRSNGISARARILNATIQTVGPTNTLSYPGRAKRRFKAICSTTTGPMWSPIPNGRRICASVSRQRSCSGANTIFRRCDRLRT